jgi:hypothetical protein
MPDQDKPGVYNEKTANKPRRSWWSRPDKNAKEQWVEAREDNEDLLGDRAKQRVGKQ